MAQFSNQATLSYNNITVPSNIAYGEITDLLSVSKTAVKTTYSTTGEVIAYVITITNSGTTAVTGITVTDNLGAYTSASVTYYPLTYVANTLVYLTNGAAQPTPSITTTLPLVIDGISVPAGGVATLAFYTTINEYARFGTADSITNTVTVASSAGDITDSAVITTSDMPVLNIQKTISPQTVTTSGTVTYTLTITNSGNTAALTSDDIVISDTFDPTLSNLTVTFNTTPWTGDISKYSYNSLSGLFETVKGAVTVPAATYSVDPLTGRTVVTNGVSVLTITGTI